MTTRSSLAEQALDAMPQHVAVLNAAGVIDLVNAGWLRFACENGFREAKSDAFVGVDYLQVLAAAQGEGKDTANFTYESMRAVLRGESAHFSLEYPCDSPSEKRWFILDVKPTLGRDGAVSGAVVVHTDITARKALEQQLAQLAHRDSLTGLASRAFFLAHAERLLALAERNKRAMHLIYLDLNGFKPVNDTYGHAAGDYLLVKVAERFKRRVRESDLLARLGGDEFVALVEDNTEAVTIGCRYLNTLEDPFKVDGQEVRVGASVGVATFPQDGRTVQELLHVADELMYQAKKRGGGVVTHSSSLPAPVGRNH